MTCQSCTAPTTNGLALCDLCQMRATTIFEHLPVYFRNLARWRPGRAGSRPVPSSREPSNNTTAPTDRVSIALDKAGEDITRWARRLNHDRIETTMPASNDEASSVRVACWYLNENLTTVALLDWAGDMLHEIAHHEALLRALTEAVAPGWYAGACARQIGLDEPCGAPTFVVPGLTWVTCRMCGATTYARDHLETIVNEARDWVARPMRLAEAIVCLVDTEQSIPRLHKRISKWGERGTIPTVRHLDADGDPSGPKSYRLGDVLDTLYSDGATRLDNLEAEAS